MNGPARKSRWLRYATALALLAVGVRGCAIIAPSESLLVLEDLAARDGPSRLKARTPSPQRSVVRYGPAERRYVADLYRTAAPPRAALVLVPGVAEQGRRDPRLVALARTLARARFLVFVPDLPGLRRLEIRARNIADVGAALRELAGHHAPAGGLPLGVGAFSYAAGPAVLAAYRAHGAARPDFIVAVGGYYDLHRVLAYLTTGHFRTRDGWQEGPVNRRAKWHFLQSNLQRLDDRSDRRVLAALAARKLADPDAPVGQAMSGLSTDGRAVLALLTNDDPEAVPALLADLPASLRRALDALTLANKDLSGLESRLILIHGPRDPLIPYTESLALARAAPNTAPFVVEGLAHVDLHPERLDRAALTRAIQAVLDQRVPERGS